MPHCNLCVGPTRPPDRTLECKHKVCGLCADECARHGCAGYCGKCKTFGEKKAVSEPEALATAPARATALGKWLEADRLDRTIRSRSKTMGMTKDESTRFASLLREAYDGCRAALKADESDHHAYCVLGMVKRSQGHSVRSFEAFTNCVEIEPAHASANYYLGLLSLKNGDYRRATAYLKRSVKTDPTHVGAHRSLTQLLKDGDASFGVTADGAAEKAMNDNPRDASCLNTYGLTLLKKGNKVAAEEAFRAAARENPKHAKAHYNLGCALKDQGKYDHAEVAWRESLRCDPELPDAWSNVAMCYAQKKAFPEAAACLRKELALDKDHKRAIGLMKMVEDMAAKHAIDIAEEPAPPPPPSSKESLKAKAMAALDNDDY